MNFSDADSEVVLDKEYKNILTGVTAQGKVILPPCGYLVLE